MPYVLIIHEVDAYPAWKTIFDQAAQIRKQAGEIRDQLLRHETEANRLVHFSEWTSLDNARSLAEIIRSKVAEARYVFQGETIPITISIGVALLTDNDRSATDIIARADEKLYEAKRSGRNRVC